MEPARASSMSYATDVVGRTEPRIWTPPLRELTPDTSYGYDVIAFAEEIGWPLDPWQRWVVIHLGELLEDGRPRFRTVLILVARQNGKTLLCRLLILYWLWVEQVKLVIGMNTGRDTAKKSWREVINMARENEMLAQDIGPRSVRETLGEESFQLLSGPEYLFFANNSRAGRSLTVDRALIDELREHKDWDTWDAAINAMQAVDDAQAVCITNQGDIKAIVLDQLREAAIEFLETGVGDHRLGIFEYSAPNNCEVDDPEALAMANPNLNRRIMLDSILGTAIRVKRAGGAALARFKTEVLCMRVTSLNAAIDDMQWLRCGTDEPIDMAQYRRQVALCLDVSLDSQHATLSAAAKIDGKVHVEVVKTWQGPFTTKEVRRDLPRIVAKVKARKIGWFPSGPTAAIAASMVRRAGSEPWPPRGTILEEIKTETKAVCMGLVEQVNSNEIQHPKDPMLDQHVKQTEKLKSGDGFVFTRQGTRPIDGTYSLAGAVHLARTMPPAPRPVVGGTA